MKIKRPSLILCALLTSFGLVSGVFANEEQEKLQALERALKTPGTEGQSAEPGKKKVRTRAIVFDNAPEPATAPNAAQAAQPATEAIAAAPANCSALAPDAPATAVDFAIQFEVGSATIAASSEGLLTQIAKLLAMDNKRCILVEGHTDITGNAEKNTALSRARAESVVKYLDKSGIELKRLIPVGKGSAEPLKNLDPRHPKNRRVVFKVVG